MTKHKFAHKWTWWGFTISAPNFEERGKIDLSGMSDGGIVKKGPRSDKNGKPLSAVNGKAYNDATGNPSSISLTTDDGETFAGLLVEDTGNKMKIVGSRKFPAQKPALKKDKKPAQDGQNEEGWVITKP